MTSSMILFALFAFGVGIISTTASSALGQSNVLLKDDFESDKSAPDGWNKGAAIPGVEYAFDKENGNSGSASLKLAKTANRFFPIAQWHRTVKHDSELTGVKIKTMVKTKLCSKAILDVQFLDGNGQPKGHQWVARIGDADDPVTHDWKEYAGEVAVPAGTKKIMFGLQIYGPGKVWFDDLEATYFEGAEPAAEVPAATAEPAEEQAEAKPELKNKVEIKIGDDLGHYLGVPARNKEVPEDGYGLLVVLPGGDGSADFHPFVANIHANALGEDFVLAQPLAKQWTDDQVIVWPTSKAKVEKVGYTTEKLIAAVIKDVGEKTKVDPKRVYLLGWSSSGPAVYATLMKRNAPVAGGIAAMSIYKPGLLPKPAGAKGKSVYILHSPDDEICPYWMAEAGRDELTKAKVRTKMVEYVGGHGWRGDVFGNIKAGVDWLETPKADR